MTVHFHHSDSQLGVLFVTFLDPGSPADYSPYLCMAKRWRIMLLSMHLSQFAMSWSPHAAVLCLRLAPKTSLKLQLMKNVAA